MNSNTKVILGILAAGAVGVAVGMLLAPDKGSETRKAINNKLGNAAGAISDLIESGKNLIATGKDKLANVANEVYSKADDAKSEFKREGERVKNSIS